MYHIDNVNLPASYPPSKQDSIQYEQMNQRKFPIMKISHKNEDAASNFSRTFKISDKINRSSSIPLNTLKGSTNKMTKRKLKKKLTPISTKHFHRQKQNCIRPPWIFPIENSTTHNHRFMKSNKQISYSFKPLLNPCDISSSNTQLTHIHCKHCECICTPLIWNH